MKIRIGRDKMLLIMIYVLCSALGIMVGYYIRNTEFVVGWLGIITLINFVYAELLIYKFSEKILSFANIFVVFLYLFHFGHVFILLFDQDHYFSNLDLEVLLGHNYFILSELFSLLFVTFCVTGVVWKLEKKHSFQFQEIERCQIYNKNKLMFTGVFVILISFPIHLRISLQQIQMTAAGDYFDSFNINVSGLQSAISSFLVMGIIMIMLVFHKNRVILFVVYGISVIYYAWTMMSGGRGHAVIAIMLLTFVLLKLIKISVWKLIALFFVAYFVMKCLTAIAQIRNFGDINLEKVVSSMREVENPIVSTFEEFGGTQYTVGLVLKHSESNQYAFGTTYIESLVSILPNINGIFTEINKNAIFTLQLNEAYIGGSIIGESYYNFGIFGFVVAYIIGVLVGKISVNVERVIEEKSYNLLAYYVMPCFGVIWWIRDSFNSVCRNSIWAWLFIMFFYYIYDHIIKKE